MHSDLREREIREFLSAPLPKRETRQREYSSSLFTLIRERYLNLMHFPEALVEPPRHNRGAIPRTSERERERELL